MVGSEERMAALEARTARLEARVARLDARAPAALGGGAAAADAVGRRNATVERAPRRRAAGATQRAWAAGAGSRVATSADAQRSETAADAPRSETAANTQRSEMTATAPRSETAADAPRKGGAGGSAVSTPAAARLEDIVGGRVLGWVGGIAVVVGILFLLVIAASRGWIGEEARVLMAACASLALLAAGAWLHERRGRAEAALAAAAAGVAGLFAAVVAAGPVYDLLPALATIALALAVGVVATALALRWAAQGIGWLGILGGLASPALAGAAADDLGIALMLVAYAAAAAVLLWQRWHALAGAAFLVAIPQLAWWLVDWSGDGGPSAGLAIAALAGFGVVTAAGAVGFEWRTRAGRLRVSAHVLLALNALALSGLGAAAFGTTRTDVWLAALALAHLAAALITRASGRVSRELPLALAGLGIVLADVAFASVADGLPLVLGWAAGAVAFAALARTARQRADETVALAGLGGHLLLAAATAVTGVAPLSVVGGGASDQAAAIAALAALAAGSWAAARIVAPRMPAWRLALDAAALLAVGLLSAVALDGAALTLALAGEAAALAGLARRQGGLAAAGTRAPAGRQTAPAADTPTPAGRQTAAAADTPTPAGRQTAAAAGTPTPAGRQTAAAADTPTPAGRWAGATTAGMPSFARRQPQTAPADRLPFPAALAFLGAALFHALVVLAPPDALIAGVDAPLATLAGLGAVVAAAVAVGRAAPLRPHRTALLGGAAIAGLYLASVLLVTPFQPGADSAGLALAELDVRQQGQALLSALWALAGVCALVAGLVRDARALRLGALALIGVTVGKVFLYDLSSLTSLYRVGSCIALGLLLLIGAFAWQRIRPRALPDLRGVPGALR